MVTKGENHELRKPRTGKGHARKAKKPTSQGAAFDAGGNVKVGDGGPHDAGSAPEKGFWRHTFVTLALALIAALTITTSLAIMFPDAEAPEGVTFTQCGGDAECEAFEAAGYAPFTSNGFPCEEDEALTFAVPEAGTSPDGIACVHHDVLENNAIMDALAFCDALGGTLVGFDFGKTDDPLCRTPEPMPTSTMEGAQGSALPTATPCPAPTLPGCEERAAPRPDLGRTAALCKEVSALMRALVMEFTPNGEPPSRTLMGKLARVNEPVCTARIGVDARVLCTSTQVAVNDVLDRVDKEPNVLSQSQLALLRQAVDAVCT